MEPVERRVWTMIEAAMRLGGMVAIDKVVTELIQPLVAEIERLRQAGERWVTLPEAQRQSGRSAGYFDGRPQKQDGRRRLDLWRARGLAAQTEEGTWLLSPAAVEEARRDARPMPEPAPPADGSNPFLKLIEHTNARGT
jgi:hypothetical protein